MIQTISPEKQSKNLFLGVKDVFFEQLRRIEYSILDNQNQVYLDYTGGNLFPKSLVQKHQDLLLNTVFGNPHSVNPTSQRATDLVEETRAKVLQFFNAQDYYCIFTPNASGALKIVGESYPFTCKSSYVLTADNHNSVNGIREFCRKQLGDTHYVPVNQDDLLINTDALFDVFNQAKPDANNLFAFPAQSNVSGIKHDLELIKYAQQKGFDVLLDAAAFVPTSRLDLSIYQPDFVSISFYKIFGYPTGIGCLLVHKSKFDKLKKSWFAGGTVTLVSVASQKKFLTNNHERFEDGTINYNTIPTIKFGLEYIESIGIERISKRVNLLAKALFDELKTLKHDNGRSLVKIYGTENFEKRGGNLCMNFYDKNGGNIPLKTIEKLTSEKQISIRTGCFCNPGIDEINNQISQAEMNDYFMNHENGNYDEMCQFLQKNRGAVRVSVGVATNSEDLEKFVNVIKSIK
ncbi:MAG: aminotransferase class V-fold PLP-dependent enzyme [Spirosomaceae bacterium]|jgi:selenocysteine lyase/cysteine desulfurase|nr:aminotransferase class V-fold PLP-dependent enzyme [Spirosomataceae bacterium]